MKINRLGIALAEQDYSNLPEQINMIDINVVLFTFWFQNLIHLAA